MLGLHSAINANLGISPAPLVCGMELRLPGEFFTVEEEGRSVVRARNFAKKLANALQRFAR